jgi:hypothetical protein
MLVLLGLTFDSILFPAKTHTETDDYNRHCVLRGECDQRNLPDGATGESTLQIFPDCFLSFTPCGRKICPISAHKLKLSTCNNKSYCI